MSTLCSNSLQLAFGYIKLCLDNAKRFVFDSFLMCWEPCMILSCVVNKVGGHAGGSIHMLDRQPGTPVVESRGQALYLLFYSVFGICVTNKIVLMVYAIIYVLF